MWASMHPRPAVKMPPRWDLLDTDTKSEYVQPLLQEAESSLASLSQASNRQAKHLPKRHLADYELRRAVEKLAVLPGVPGDAERDPVPAPLDTEGQARVTCSRRRAMVRSTMRSLMWILIPHRKMLATWPALVPKRSPE